MNPDPQLRSKLETLMLVYPDVTVKRALGFLDEADEMLQQVAYGGYLSEEDFRKLTEEDR